MDMRINPITYNYKSIINNRRNIASNINTTFESKNLPSFYPYTISFYGYRPIRAIDYNARKQELKDAGISDEYIEKFSKYRQERYEKVRQLMDTNCFEKCIPILTKLPKRKFERAVELVAHNVIDENLYSLVELPAGQYKRILSLKDKGIDSNYLEAFSQLNTEQTRRAKLLMRKGFTPIDSAYLSLLSENKAKKSVELIKLGIPCEIAVRIVSLGDKITDGFLECINEGMSPDDAEDYVCSDVSRQKNIDYLISNGIYNDTALNIADLTEDEQKKSYMYYKQGVFPDHIPFIVLAEENDDEIYNAYRDRGYSRTVSFVLSLFDAKGIKILNRIIKANPIIKDLLKQEYDITLINIQNKDIPGAVFTKVQPFGKDNTVKNVYTFDTEGNSTASRISKINNNVTTSISQNGSDVLKLEYGEKGEIKSVTQYIQNPETKSTKGVLYSEFSDVIPGVLQSVYFDIDDFITSSTSNEADIERPILNSVRTKGMPVSRTFIDDKGNSVFEEYFKFRNYTTHRSYKEKKDEHGNIISSSYEYDIFDESNNIMNISREILKTGRNSAIHKINGITYRLTYNNNNKSITVTDGKNTKTLNFKDKLAYYSSDVLWTAIKNIPIDNLMTIHNNIESWNYCRETEAVADGYTDTLSTGKDTAVIAHETGHLKDYEVKYIAQNEDLKKLYLEEMYEFTNIMPYDGFEVIAYMSPFADLLEASGIDEFIAETNCILSGCGTTENKYKLRSQFMVRYFPKSIAKAAELLGKTSKKSLLDE